MLGAGTDVDADETEDLVRTPEIKDFWGRSSGRSPSGSTRPPVHLEKYKLFSGYLAFTVLIRRSFSGYIE